MGIYSHDTIPDLPEERTMDRYLTVIGTIDGRTERHVFKFSSAYRDSAALHEALCLLDPEGDYSCWFGPTEPLNMAHATGFYNEEHIMVL